MAKYYQRRFIYDKRRVYSQIDSFSDLIDFCERNNCYDIIEDIKHVDDFDEWVWDEIEELRSHWFWTELKDMLSDLEAPYTEYFKPEGALTYITLDNEDLEEYIDNVIVWGEENDFWDEDEDESDWSIEDLEIENEEEPAFESEIELTMLIGVA